MIEVPLGRFDISALALPRGHGFGDQIPYEVWETDDGKALSIITSHADHGDLGLIVMRCRSIAAAAFPSWPAETCQSETGPEAANIVYPSPMTESGPLTDWPFSGAQSARADVCSTSRGRR